METGRTMDEERAIELHLEKPEVMNQDPTLSDPRVFITRNRSFALLPEGTQFY